MRQDQRGTAALLDELGHREGLAGTGDAQQNLMFFAVFEPARKFRDRGFLVAFGL